MNRALAGAVLLAAFAAGCGDGSGFGIGVAIEGLNASQVGALQFSVLKNGSSYNCVTLSQTCLNSQVAKTDLVPITESDGSQHVSALLFADGTKVVGSGQVFTISVPVGQDYLLVAEVLPPTQNQLLASGCAYLGQVAQNGNAPVSVTALAISPVPSCNPVFQ